MLPPLLLATLQSTAVYSLSNILAQLIATNGDFTGFSFDFTAFFYFVIWAFVSAPVNYKWQELLEWLFPAYTTSEREPVPETLPLTNQDIEIDEPDEKTGLLEKPKPKRLNFRNTALKWFIDSITVGITMNVSIFMIVMGVLKHQPLEVIWENFRTNIFTIILASYRIWPIAAVVSFTCIPVERRTVFSSCVGFIWGIYMSLTASQV